MSSTGWRRRFLAHGVFWRHFLRWAVLNVPFFLEPMIMGAWSLYFVTVWTSGRRGVTRNLRTIFPDVNPFARFLKVCRVFWNFGWTLDDNIRFNEMRTIPDWEFIGTRSFHALQTSEEGAIILTAHMGSYDLAAQLFSERSHRKVTMVRAPEVDPETRDFEARATERVGSDSLKIDFNTKASALAFDLLEALQRGDVVAIQGDRVTPGIASMRTTLFGRPADLPSGPFALAMATRLPIYPIFIIRMGRRSYRLVADEPFYCTRTSRDRDRDLEEAVARWAGILERTVREYWYQWYNFVPFEAEKPMSSTKAGA